MIDLHQLFAGLVRAVQGADFPEADTIAESLDLDVAAARISKTKRGLLTIYGAKLKNEGAEIDVIAALRPRRALTLLLPNSPIEYRDVEGETFGANQRRQRSKRSDGFAVLFDVDGLTGGLTASAPTGVVEAVFCEAPRPATAG